MSTSLFAHIGTGPCQGVPRLSLNLAHVLAVVWTGDGALVTVDYHPDTIPLSLAEADALIGQMWDAADSYESGFKVSVAAEQSRLSPPTDKLRNQVADEDDEPDGGPVDIQARDVAECVS